MSGIIITEHRKCSPKIWPCVCGSTDIHDRAGHGCGFSAYATITCKKCGLEMTESDYSCGWNGVTVESLYRKVVSRWNKVMNKTTPPLPEEPEQ